jgi:alginate O-acetyltransferase complex protein AlgJ
VISLADALENAKSQEPVFLKTDTHWTSFGASIAASAIAINARSLADLGDEVPVSLSSGDVAAHHGDLLRYIRLGPFSDTAGPKPDMVRTWSANIETGETLLGETDIPVALVGTSYSADARWSFRAFLAHALKSDVLNVSSEGKGPFDPMTEYLQSPSFSETPPKLVIWEIPERFLDDPMQKAAEVKPHG